MSELSPELKQKCKHYRISQHEYEKICSLLGHAPQGVEWALFSALWSEHCSYKSSKIHLRKFSYRNSSIFESEGENAGIVDLGYGEKIAFKMESHNHPSFIEPYQGAATGVGGILRDIFTMGARPIALADYLCFGEPGADRMSQLVDGVVKGISGYGNCVGVPTIAGQTEIHSSYNKNILVNAMAVGLLRNEDPIALSGAQGEGNWVIYVGAKTGKDGVHGASMASESFDDKSESKKPNVQIGDPFYEKLLIEACLEILKKNLVVAMQDMGAAGLTSSSFEMAAKGNVGFIMNLDQVPLRDSSMSPEEILLSESQERMLLVCRPDKFEQIKAILNRWELDATHIGFVQKEHKMLLRWHGETLVEIDPHLLTENAPRYERSYQAWKPHSQVANRHEFYKLKNSGHEILSKMMQDPRFTAKNWIFEQYDQRVGTRTSRDATQTVAMQELPDTKRGLAIAVGCRSTLMRMDARIGALDAILYPALQMAVKGAKALAATDCLNFGNPEKPEIMTEFVTTVESLAAVAKELDAPVISGNVSFYNETLGQNITSTPAIGLVGLRKNLENIPYDQFQANADLVYWLKLPMVKTQSFLAELQDLKPQFVGDLDVIDAVKWIKGLQEIVENTNVHTSKVVGKGGLGFTLAQMSMGQYQFKAHSQTLNGMSPEKFFHEDLYEVVMAVDSHQKEDFIKKLDQLKKKIQFEYEEIGFTHQGDLVLNSDLQYDIVSMKKDYQETWQKKWSLV